MTSLKVKGSDDSVLNNSLKNGLTLKSPGNSDGSLFT
jgi:hypothetical protein